MAGGAALKVYDYKRAIAEFTKALALSPTNVSALCGRALAYSQTQEFPQAQADYDAALACADPARRTDILIGMSYFHAFEKRFDLALADISECVKKGGTNLPQLLDMRGQIYYGAKQSAAAYADFSEAIRLAPEFPDVYTSRAAFLLEEKRLDEAFADVSQAILLDPSRADEFAQRALILIKLDRNQAALADLQTALRLDPQNKETSNNLAWLLATCPEAALRDGKKAVQCATRACELGAWRDGWIVDTLAAACAEAGDYKAAVGWQENAMALTPGGDVRDEMARRLELYREGKPYREAAPDAKVAAWETLRYQTFETVWQTVNDAYFDPEFGGVDWAGVREKYRQQLDTAVNVAQLRVLLGRMLGELRRTHFAIIPREGAVFNPSERVRIGSAGVELTALGTQPAVVSVKKGSPAQAAGLQPGDVIDSVNGKLLAPVAESLSKAGFSEARVSAYLTGYVDSFLTAAVGKSVDLGISRADGKPGQVKVTCGPTQGQWSDPIGYFPSMPVRTQNRMDGPDVAVIKFNVFVPQVMLQIRAFMKTVGPESGLVIDVRGNPGGVTVMAAGICGLVDQKEASLGSLQLRDSTAELEIYPTAHPFAGPVAVLVDSRSASTSEVLAAGIRDIGRARIFGEKSPGMALPSFYKTLPTGDLFQFAVADFTTPRGVSLEGNGVEPDVVVAPTRDDLTKGRDPVLEAAEAWIREQLRSSHSPS
jgi:carboxyl-terminal processing protease